MPKFGPGELKIGDEAAAIDASCLVNECTIEPDKDTGDSKTMLCGTVKPGSVTYTYTLTGNLDVDSDDPSGLFAYCDANAGRQVPFTFTPSNGGTVATGTVVLDPLAFGGEEYGEDMASDFEFDVVGKPTYEYPTPEAFAVTSAGIAKASGAFPTEVRYGKAGTDQEVHVVDQAAPATDTTSTDTSTSTAKADTTKATAKAS